MSFEAVLVGEMEPCDFVAGGCTELVVNLDSTTFGEIV